MRSRHDVARLVRSLATAISLVSLVLLGACRGSGSGEARVFVPRGATLRVAAESLVTAGVVQNATMFRIYAKVKGGDRSIQAGTYLFKRGASWGSILDDLRGGKGVEHAMTIPEGWSLLQIAPQLARVLKVPIDSVQAAVRDTALLRALNIPTPTLEGYLFPDTYVFQEGTTARTAVRLMVERFQRVWQPAWDQRLQALAMNRHDIMALASIVEKEARLPEERPVIAAVYMNRVRAGMLLQADPTVQYALGRHVSRLFYRDLEVESPYNTYKHAGLPPGPIASPGRPSIEAALNPANVPYLFFVAFPDGHHEFTRDFAAHSGAVRRARRQWDSLAALRRDTTQSVNGASGAAAPASRR